MADEKLQIDITAKDDASKVIDPLQKKLEKLEDTDAVVEVDADTKSAVDDVDTFAKKLDKLGSSDQVVLLALRAGAAQQEITQLATDIAQLDASDPNIDVKIERYNELTQDLDQIETKIKAIGDTDIDGGGHMQDAARKLDAISESSGKAKDAVHGMAGGAIGDFASTATGIGPLGEALGQMTEAAAAGEASISELATAGLSMGGLAAAIYVVQGALKSMAAVDAFHADQVTAYTKAIADGSTAVEAYAKQLESVGKVQATLSSRTDNLAKWLGIGDDVKDVTAEVVKAGLSLDQYTQLVAGSTEAVGAWAQSQLDAGADGKLIIDVVDAITEAHKDLITAQDNSATSAKFFTQTAAETTAAADDYVNALADVASNHRNTTSDTRKLINALRDAKDATNDLTGAYDRLSGEVDQDQSMINLKSQIDNVTSAGQAAYTAQHEADVARRDGAKDAAEKQADADRAMRDYQTSINDTKLSIIDLGQTAGANPVEVKAELDKITTGDLSSVAADAEGWFARNPIDAATRLKLISTAVAGVGQPVQITGQSIQSAPAVVNNYLARASSARELGRTQARHTRINGR